MKNISFLKKFSISFVDVIYKKRNRKKILEELKVFLEIFSDNRELQKVLVNPVLPLEIREKIVEKICTKIKCAPELTNFLKILVKNYAIKYLKDIYQLAVDEINRREGIKYVEMKVAPPYRKKMVEKVEKILEEKTGMDIVIEIEEREDLIAGFWLKIGSQIFDGSLKGQLERLENKLTS